MCYLYSSALPITHLWKSDGAEQVIFLPLVFRGVKFSLPRTWRSIGTGDWCVRRCLWKWRWSLRVETLLDPFGGTSAGEVEFRGSSNPEFPRQKYPMGWNWREFVVDFFLQANESHFFLWTFSLLCLWYAVDFELPCTAMKKLKKWHDELEFSAVYANPNDGQQKRLPWRCRFFRVFPLIYKSPEN